MNLQKKILNIILSFRNDEDGLSCIFCWLCNLKINMIITIILFVYCFVTVFTSILLIFVSILILTMYYCILTLFGFVYYCGFFGEKIFPPFDLIEYFKNLKNDNTHLKKKMDKLKNFTPTTQKWYFKWNNLCNKNQLNCYEKLVYICGKIKSSKSRPKKGSS